MTHLVEGLYIGNPAVMFHSDGSPNSTQTIE